MTSIISQLPLWGILLGLFGLQFVLQDFFHKNERFYITWQYFGVLLIALTMAAGFLV